MTEYKVGDKVVLVTERPENWNSLGLMDGFLGSVQTISNLDCASKWADVEFYGSKTARWHFKLSNILGLAGKTGSRVDMELVEGRKYLVLSGDDDNFPKGTVVTCINTVAGWFSSERWTDMYMFDFVELLEILDPTENTVPTAPTAETDELTFIQLIEKLPELEEGTVIDVIDQEQKGIQIEVVKADTSIGTVNKLQYAPKNRGNALYTTEVSVSELTVFNRKYRIIPVLKEVYTAITWQEALKIVSYGGTVYAGEAHVAVDEYTPVENIAEDFDDILCVQWYLKEFK